MIRGIITLGTALGMLHLQSPLAAQEKSFQGDVDFLAKHIEVLVLGEAGGPQVAVVPAYQGRVMTSTAGGPAAASYGWINYGHIESGTITPHINIYGGEERFWLGPEGGQFSIFFPPGAKFEFAEWQTPALIDTEPFEATQRTDSSVRFRHIAKLTNYSRAEFEFLIDRTVELLTSADAERSLGKLPDSVRFVGYRTVNRLTNLGANDWKKDSGLLSIWLLGMYKPGPRTTVVVPFRRGGKAELGPIVNDAYFGKPPADRLVIGDGVLYFSGDGQFRSKIGLSPQRARDVCGSWDAEAGVLTIVKYNQPEGDADYVNSMWELQKEPYAGDVVNSYNDGPPAPGAKPLGPFYELETSSPALALASKASAEHVQETYHFEGDRAALDALAVKLLGAPLERIEAALK